MHLKPQHQMGIILSNHLMSLPLHTIMCRIRQQASCRHQRAVFMTGINPRFQPHHPSARMPVLYTPIPTTLISQSCPVPMCTRQSSHQRDRFRRMIHLWQSSPTRIYTSRRLQFLLRHRLTFHHLWYRPCRIGRPPLQHCQG